MNPRRLAPLTALLAFTIGVAADPHTTERITPQAAATPVPPTLEQYTEAEQVRLDVMLLRRIGGCESSGSPMGELRWDAPNNYGSSASGAFQIIDSTWRYWLAEFRPDLAGQYPRALDAPREVQIEVALAALNRWGGNRSSTWAASHHCWMSR